ncbi:hypothetical protein LCGC14_1855690 [marine sediment metagenome]|uniref:Uncharacterized protein n=1 Tax=marine sediment metagenome TaxID=412755 RepID=A0A0F9INK7_9ZZZZ
MSDMMGPATGPTGPQPGQDVRSKMSVLNPTDMASKLSSGDIRPQQTVGEFLQRNFGVTPQDPVEKLFANIKGQAQNATVPGKMGLPQGPRGAPPPAAPPGMAPQGAPQAPRGMDDLMKRM